MWRTPGLILFATVSAFATPYFFSTGNPDGLMGMASRPGVGGKIEIEAADDFLLAAQTRITGATFTGILQGTNPSGATPTIDQVIVEIYRVFPNDSDTV